MTTVVLVQQGGTGANNAAEARAALSVPSSNDVVLKTGDTMTGQLNIADGGLIVQSDDSERAAFIRSPTRTLRITPYYNSEGSDKGTWLEAINTSNAAYNKFTLSGSNIILEPTGNVGIGNTSPTQKLHVEGKVRATQFVSSNTQFYLTPDSTSYIKDLYISDNNTTTGYLQFGEKYIYGTDAVTGGDFEIKTNGNSYFNSGNVGIGNTNPQSKLTVAGRVESTTGGFKFPDGTTQTTAAASVTGIPTLNVVNTTTTTAVAGYHYVLANTSATTLTLPASPSVADIVWITVGNGRVDNIVGRNGSKINSLEEDLTIDIANVAIQLRYVDNTRGWLFT